MIAGMDARTLAAEIVAMSGDKFGSAFKGSAFKRAKLAGLRHNAAVMFDADAGSSCLSVPQYPSRCAEGE